MGSSLANEVYLPESVEEAITLLNEKDDRSVLLSGGTDLVLLLKSGTIKTSCIIDISKLPLNYINGSVDKGLRIGATTTAKEICKSEILRKDLPVLVEAAAQVGGPQTQELATIGGNICNASPAANLSTVLVALNAKVKLVSVNGEREINIKDFFVGPGKTEIHNNEMLFEVIIPAIPKSFGASFIKHTIRKEMDIAIIGTSVALTRNGKLVEDVKISLAAIGPKVFLAEKAQAVLFDQEYRNDIVEKAADIAVGESSFITDVRSTASYRKKVASVIIRRAIQEAWQKAGGEN